MSPASSSGSEGALSDAEEELGVQQESISTPGSKHGDEMVSSSSSDEDDNGQSEDGDYEIETPAEEPLEDPNESDIPVKGASNLKKYSKQKPVDDFHENPDLYGLRRSVSQI